MINVFNRYIYFFVLTNYPTLNLQLNQNNFDDNAIYLTRL
jgi:hypothetical protein